MLEDALELCDGPAAIRWPKTAAPHVDWDETGSGLRGRRVREGTDVCLLGAGKMLAAASGAADLLAAEGISATVWDPRVIRPLDPEMLADAARARQPFLAVELVERRWHTILSSPFILLTVILASPFLKPFRPVWVRSSRRASSASSSCSLAPPREVAKTRPPPSHREPEEEHDR